MHRMTMWISHPPMSPTSSTRRRGISITVTCTVGAASTEGECDEKKQGGYYEHVGDHGGASASCTIKFWRVDLEANVDLDPVIGYPHYEFEFATDVTNTATVGGGTAIEYLWKSYVGGTLHKQVTTTGGSWSGEIVAYTGIECRAKVVNACDLTTYSYRTESIYLDPDIRRPGWTTEVQLAGTDDNWLSGDGDAFPQIDWSVHADGTKPDYGRLANARIPYDLNYDEVVVPLYSEQIKYSSDYAAFESKTTEITGGPNEGFFYNTDPTMYEIRRKALSNYWINPAASHPASPALDNNGNPYTNWLSVEEAAFGTDCSCLDPSVHGGTGTGAWFRANRWHENSGSPASPNKRLLGHFSRLEDYYAANSRSLVDPIYRCDLKYSSTRDGLRAADEAERAAASALLLGAIGALHPYVQSDPAKHNFTGDILVYQPLSGWNAYSKRF